MTDQESHQEDESAMNMLAYAGIGMVLCAFWFAVGIAVGRYFAG